MQLSIKDVPFCICIVKFMHRIKQCCIMNRITVPNDFAVLHMILNEIWMLNEFQYYIIIR